MLLLRLGAVFANIPPPSPSPPPPAASPPPTPPEPPSPPDAPPHPPVAPLTCMWAAAATASSQYSSSCNKGSSQNACELTDAPDVAPTCADTSGAWSPSTGASTPEWVSVTFGADSFFTIYSVSIYETYSAPFVTKVEVLNSYQSGASTILWQGTDTTSCGSSFDIRYIDGAVGDSIKITTVGSGYEQIDAVQMCGISVPLPPAPSPLPPAPPSAPPPCESQVDLTLVIDNSGSVGAQRPNVIDFARKVVAQFEMGSNAAQIAYVEFETTVVTHVALTPSLSTILTALDNAPAIGSGTFLSGGIAQGQAVVTGTGARSGVPKVIVLMSDGVQTVGGDDNTAIAAATNAKNAGIKIIAVGFGSVSLVTLNALASSPSSEFSRYQSAASDLVQLIVDGTLGICVTATDKPRGPPPSPPVPPSPPSPPLSPPLTPPLPSMPPVDCSYCSDLYTAFGDKETQFKQAGSCPSGSSEDSDADGKRVCKLWQDGRMWFVPRE